MNREQTENRTRNGQGQGQQTKDTVPTNARRYTQP